MGERTRTDDVDVITKNKRKELKINYNGDLNTTGWMKLRLI